MKSFFKLVFDFIIPEENDQIKQASQQWSKRLPTLWLLGKTGAGKSSLIQAITKDSSINIGNGFSPCTKTAQRYDFPPNKPIIRFLDTRGLSESDYNPSDDIKIFEECRHALVIVMKIDETEQSDVIDALRKIKQFKNIQQVLVVHTVIRSVDEKGREQALNHNQHQVEKVWGNKIDFTSVDFTNPDELFGLEKLIDKISKILPSLTTIIENNEHASREEENFYNLRTDIIWYSGVAGTSDFVPAIGIVSVPAIQGKMLHSLARQYGVDWDKQTFRDFIGILGVSFALQYTAKFALRQAVKFIPIYGQTVGAGTAAVISSASTYALGRVACKYLYHKNRGETVSRKEMQKLYKDALYKGKEVAKNETN